MLQIKLKTSHHYIKTECILCAQVFTLDGVDAALYEGNEKIGDVCEECIKKGEAEIPGIIKSHADWLRKRADTLDAMAKAEIECPTWEQFKFFEDSGPPSGPPHTG